MVYLDPYRSQESRDPYTEVVSEWLARNSEQGATCPFLSIGKLSLAYLNHARRHYRKNGQETSEVNIIRQTLKSLCTMYAKDAGRNFGPAKLKAVRQSLIDSGNPRSTIHAHIGRIRRMFR
ncbi:MAG: hypothetical protein KDA52_04755 [Planctomycetaceae bacterium]|nr:hypothetical protein [Planctomycetaceae bacterium]